MKKPTTPRRFLLPLSAALALALSVSSFASAKGTVERKTESDEPEKTQKENVGPTFSRKIWTGSFDRAADASGAAAKQLESVDDDDCHELLKITKDNPEGDQEAYQSCLQRQQNSKRFAAQAKSIQKQQNAMSIVSKASDAAGVAAVGGVIYSEMLVKKNNQSDTYDHAANIERMAGTASYATGAVDLTLGAYAYVAQKNKLEQIKKQFNSSDLTGSSDKAVNSALTGAAEAAKKAAYSHMMWGAGKVAAGYGMMYLAKKSEDQAAKMQSLQDDKDLAQFNQMRAAAAGTLPTQAAYVNTGSTSVPYYQNNNPTFALNTGAAASGLAAHTGPVTYSLPGGGTGASGALTPENARALASAAAVGKVSGGGGGGGGGDSSGASHAPDADDAATKAKAEKAAKEAMGSSFEMQLTGGLKAYGGGAAAAGGKEETPNLAAIMGGQGVSGDPSGGQLAGTGLSPMQLVQEAQEGTDGNEQGSMAGVSGKSETSLFEITKAKLQKMVQTGNVGIPKNLEVKN